jgi:hypothetical protein
LQLEREISFQKQKLASDIMYLKEKEMSESKVLFVLDSFVEFSPKVQLEEITKLFRNSDHLTLHILALLVTKHSKLWIALNCMSRLIMGKVPSREDRMGEIVVLNPALIDIVVIIS